MASIRHPWPSLLLLFSSFLFFPSSFSSPSPLPSSPQRRLLQTPSSPPPLAQNLETFFPSISSPAFTNSPPLPPPPPPAPPNSATQSPTPQTSKSSHGHVTKAVLATAATSFAISGIVFFLFLRFSDRRRRHSPPPPAKALFRPNAQGPLKGLVVDENGLDVLYWRRLDDDGDAGGGGGVVVKRCELCSRSMRSPGNSDDADLIERNDASFQEIPLIPSNSVNSSARITPDSRIPLRSFSISQSAVSIETVARPSIPRAPPRPTPSPPKSPRAVPPPTPPPPPPPPAPPVPPPPPPPKKLSAPAPSAPPPPPPRPPLAAGRGPAAAPPPPPPGGAGPSPRPPIPARSTSGKAHPKLKPLHWDKLTPVNTEHSMVWDKITGGSFRFDDELMESLFGYVATNRKVPGGKKNTPDTTSPSTSTGSSAQICLLDPRKSQNIAIILRTLDISRQDILDSLLDGRALTSDALEKLSRTAPSKEEEAKILDFSGNPSKLSDAESFLFHLYRSVPAPFVRLDAMLFKSNYEPEILHVKQSLQTLELACKEMKTRGTFLKLLEAILKAGNRMNAGTARGNAQAFNLKALCKLSDVKSTDGKTTLLRFVVEEVVRSEGKRCVINRNHSMRRTNSTSGSSQTDPAGREEREKEYMMLGLPIVGGLSVEFANVKKAAGIDYDALLGTCSSLGERIKEIRHFLGSCRGDGFVKEMKGFLETAEEEVRIVREEQGKVVELVKRTTEYYQVGATMEKGSDPLQLFVIVRDFLAMVDQVCVHITRNLQKRKQMVGVGESRNSTVSRRAAAAARFPNLPAHFMSDNSKSGSDSDEDRF